MRNLFVIHSQAQLILAVGLVKGRFSDEQNHLILFTDFSISGEMKNVLSKIFDKILYRTGVYPAKNKSWKAKLLRYPSDIKAISLFIDSPFDKVFEVCDGNLPEIFILKKTYQLNKLVEMIWLEDGSYPYYLNTTFVDGLNSNNVTRTIRRFIFRNVFGLGRFYDFEGSYMGSNRNLTKAYLTLKGHERDIYSSKEIVSITEKEYEMGISQLYPAIDTGISGSSILLVLDKLDVYKDIALVESLIHNIQTIASSSNLNLFYKFHPREQSSLAILKDWKALDKNVGIESFYSSSLHSDITVIGVKTTGLQSSVVLGFSTISVALLVNESDIDMLKFYGSIGVKIPTTFAELESLLKK